MRERLCDLDEARSLFFRRAHGEHASSMYKISSFSYKISNFNIYLLGIFNISNFNIYLIFI